MNKLISFTGGALTLLSGFHLYLNIRSNTEVSFEKTISTLRSNIIQSPIETGAVILCILLLSLLVSYALNKGFNYVADRERKREQNINQSLENYTKREEMKDLVFDKIIDSKISFLESRVEPWNRINPEYHKIIVRDIRDTSFPESGRWWKLETFDLTKEGIEFFDPSNIIGIDIFLTKISIGTFFTIEKRLRKESTQKQNALIVLTFFRMKIY